MDKNIQEPLEGYHWIARKWFRHPKTGRIIYASAYGKKCFWFRVKN